MLVMLLLLLMLGVSSDRYVVCSVQNNVSAAMLVSPSSMEGRVSGGQTNECYTSTHTHTHTNKHQTHYVPPPTCSPTHLPFKGTSLSDVTRSIQDIFEADIAPRLAARPDLFPPGDWGV